MPRRVAETFLQIAKAGAIDPDSGDYLPPIKVDSIRIAKEVVMRSDALGVAPLSMIAAEVKSRQLVALPLQLPWMKTGYGFVYLRDRMLAPAAEAFMAEVRSVEAEHAAQSRELSAPPGRATAARYRPLHGVAASRRDWLGKPAPPCAQRLPRASQPSIRMPAADTQLPATRTAMRASQLNDRDLRREYREQTEGRRRCSGEREGTGAARHQRGAVHVPVQQPGRNRKQSNAHCGQSCVQCHQRPGKTESQRRENGQHRGRRKGRANRAAGKPRRG